jgi:hypothetical protein
MKRLNPQKLHVAYLNGAAPEDLVLPRRYTLTRSDRTGELFLSFCNILGSTGSEHPVVGNLFWA